MAEASEFGDVELKKLCRNDKSIDGIPGPEHFSLIKLATAGAHPVKDDDRDCIITGIKVLKDGRGILCDHNNKKLQLLNQGLKHQCSIEVPGWPWDIALLNEGEAVVTLSRQQKLQFVTVGRTLKLGRTLDTKRACWGVVVFNSQIYITCHDDPGNGEVAVLDLITGEYLRRFLLNEDPRKAVPQYIAVDAVGRLYVSDWGEETVTCLTAEGFTLFCFKDDALRRPRQLLADSVGNIYVCCWLSDTVKVISTGGEKLRTLLTASHGLIRPFTLAYRSFDKTLVVGMTGNAILSFRFQ